MASRQRETGMSPTAPPITELAFSVQFAKLTNLTVLDAADLCGRFRDRFPLIQQVARVQPLSLPPALPAAVGVVQQIEFVPQDNSLPRLWMVSSDSKKLIQFQDDRF